MIPKYWPGGREFNFVTNIFKPFCLKLNKYLGAQMTIMSAACAERCGIMVGTKIHNISVFHILYNAYKILF